MNDWYSTIQTAINRAVCEHVVEQITKSEELGAYSASSTCNMAVSESPFFIAYYLYRIKSLRNIQKISKVLEISRWMEKVVVTSLNPMPRRSWLEKLVQADSTVCQVIHWNYFMDDQTLLNVNWAITDDIDEDTEADPMDEPEAIDRSGMLKKTVH